MILSDNGHHAFSALVLLRLNENVVLLISGCSPSCYTFSPCPSTPPAGEYDAPHTPTADDDSISLRHNTSPHINKFLAREPPTGSQRVALKLSEGDRSALVFDYF